MSGFTMDWLELRDAADRRARDGKLLDQAKQWLGTRKKRVAGIAVVDLGAGTGSTLRSFDGDDGSEQFSVCWRLVDNDALLLEEARRRHGRSHTLELYEMDLADVASLPLAGAQLVTASALFDLVSAEYIDTLASALHDHCLQQPLGIYAALSYNGITRWTPRHPLDESVLAAFNRNQQRDKGFGPALGPDAARYMTAKFKALGFQVFTADSPWLLEGADHRLVRELVAGIARAIEVYPEIDKSELDDWLEFRTVHAETGSCEVGHTDLLALPKAI